jgi:HK97 gp10 family phage protein
MLTRVNVRHGQTGLKLNDYIAKKYNGVTIEISSKDLGWGYIEKAFKSKKDRHIVSCVGIFSGTKKKTQRKKQAAKKAVNAKADGVERHEKTPGGGKKSGAVNIATYAFYNEFGTRTAPSRPWMRNTFDKNVNGYVKYIESELGRWLFKKTPRRIMQDLSKKVVKQFRVAIANWNRPPNTASTIKRKGINNPLIESKKMLNAVTWKWEK